MKNNIFVFVRHGECVQSDQSTERLKSRVLSPLGCEQANAFGQWLNHIQLLPSKIIHTQTQRTKETAKHIIEALSVKNVHRQACRSGFRDMQGLESKWTQWSHSITTPKVILFVGHHSSQQALTRCYKLPIKSTDRSIVILKKTTTQWALVSWAYACKSQHQLKGGSLEQLDPKDEP
jgi:phosphohistidine phosphatase SixA